MTNHIYDSFAKEDDKIQVVERSEITSDALLVVPVVVNLF